MVSDLQMPTLDGRGFCHRLRDLRPNLPVPVVTAADAVSIDLIECPVVRDAMHKPLGADEFFAHLEPALFHRVAYAL